MFNRTADRDRIVSWSPGRDFGGGLLFDSEDTRSGQKCVRGPGPGRATAGCCLIKRTPDRDRIVSGDWDQDFRGGLLFV